MLRAILAIFIVLLTIPASVTAQTSLLPADRAAIVKDNCANSQLVLERLQKRDAVSRVNYGRAYDNTLRQIDAFNARLAYNKVNAPDLVQSASDMQSAVNRFRASYDTRYSQELSDAVDMDCRKEPEEFYAKIEKIRQERLILASDVAKVDEIIAAYRQQLIDLQQTALEGQ